MTRFVNNLYKLILSCHCACKKSSSSRPAQISSMTNYQKIGSVTRQALIGLSLGLAGAVVAYIVAYLYFRINQMRLDLFI
jgi:hypothetical protein